ncbi:hypothetical protein GGS20DRAFT_412994 [Poronia punctata]|nr:hypothetical protein GGS20DRAFT_412994 [Poronia punctata]
MSPFQSSNPQDGITGNTELVEVRTAGSMGNGVFATQDIPRGTRIMAEVPILSIIRESYDQDLPAFCAAIQRLSEAELHLLNQLYCDPSHITTEVRQRVRQWYKDLGIVDKRNGKILKGKRLQDVAKATVKRYGIYNTNRVQMGVEGRYGIGVFPLYSHLNHSCVPNAYNSYNPNIRRLTIHSTRDIRLGEQIFTSYINSFCRTRQQRQSMLIHWGFVCSCLACTDPSIEPLRKRMFQLDQSLAVWNSPLMNGIARSSARSALQDAMELVGLLNKQGLEGMELSRTYRDCSKASLELGRMDAALDYAYKELENEECIMGTETEHMRKELEGAKYWIEHLEKMCRK